MIEPPISREPTPRERLIVALDARSVAEAEHWIETLGDSISFYKVGMELGGGLRFLA